MPYKIKYPEYIVDETSGIPVKNRDYEVALEVIEDYSFYLFDLLLIKQLEIREVTKQRNINVK